MDGINRNADQIREANELYWESETSVNQIADRLGLSKGGLYAAIEPLSSDSFCPLCTARLVYLNRTALEKGHLQCSKCETEFSEKSRSATPTRRSGPSTKEGTPVEGRPPKATSSTTTAAAPAAPSVSPPETDEAPLATSNPTATHTAPESSLAAASTPATNGSHLAVTGGSREPTEELGDSYGMAAYDDDRASGQLKLSTAMLSLGVGLLLARVLRR